MLTSDLFDDQPRLEIENNNLQEENRANRQKERPKPKSIMERYKSFHYQKLKPAPSEEEDYEQDDEDQDQSTSSTTPPPLSDTKMNPTNSTTPPPLNDTRTNPTIANDVETENSDESISKEFSKNTISAFDKSILSKHVNKVMGYELDEFIGEKMKSEYA